MPVLILAVALGACSKQSEQKSGNKADTSPAVTAQQRLSTMFEADCGANTPAASAAADYDFSSCQLSGPQLNYLSGLGPYKVEADCARQTIRVRNEKEDISGEGAINEDGTFSVPLLIGPRLADLEGCPVDLQGTAAGTVKCNAEHKVTQLDLNAVYAFGSTVEETPVSSVGESLVSDTRDERGDRNEDRHDDRHQGKNVNVAKKGVAIQSKGIISKGGEFNHRHDRDRDDRDHNNRGERGERLEAAACVKFPSCGFTTKVGLSCGTATPSAAVTTAPAENSAPATTPATPAVPAETPAAPATAPSESSPSGR